MGTIPRQKFWLIYVLILVAVMSQQTKRGKIKEFQDRSNPEIIFQDGFLEQNGQSFLLPNTKGIRIIKLTSFTLFKEGHIYLSFYGDNLVPNEIAISKDNRKWEILSKNIKYEKNKLPLTKYINGRHQFYLRLKAENNYDFKAAIITSFPEFFLISRSRSNILSNIAYFFLGIFVLFCLFHRLLDIPLRKASVFVILTLLIFLLPIFFEPKFLDFSPDILYLGLGISFLLIAKKGKELDLVVILLTSLCLVCYFFTQNLFFFSRPLIILAILILGAKQFMDYIGVKAKGNILLALILIYGVALRCLRLYLIWKNGEGIDPDSSGYSQLASDFQITNFYQASFREPFFLFLLKLYYYGLNFLGLLDHAQANNFLPIRTFSLFFSIAIIFFSYKIAKHLLNKDLALMTAAFVSASSFLAFNGARGTITEFFSFLMLLFFYLLFIENRMNRNQKFILLGLMGAVLLLTRSSTPWVMLLMLIYGAIYKKEYRSPKIICSMIIAVVLAAPFYLNNKKKYGELNFITNYHATWWKNYEFMDQVGHQRAEDLMKDSYAGERVSQMAYFFKYHSLTEVAQRVILGYHKSFSKWIRIYEPLLMPLAVIGLILICCSPYKIIPFMWLIMILPYSFVIGLTGSPERFTYEAFLFIAMFAAYTCNILIKIINGKKTTIERQSQR